MIKSFIRCRRGAIAPFFGIALVPMVAFMSVALDYSRASGARTEMQSAIDAAVLDLANEPASLSDAEFDSRARAVFDRNFPATSALVVDSFTPTRTDEDVTVAASGHLHTSLITGAVNPTTNFSARGTAKRGLTKIEVALVLDNTGSMAQSGKMTALKQAAGNLIDTLAGAATTPDSVKIAVVPFATQVKVDPTLSTEPWIYFDVNKEVLAKAVSPTTWTGCLTDRDQPYDTDDTAPDTGTYEPHDTMKSTTSHGRTTWQVGTQQATTKYWAAVCDQSTLSQVQPLTDDFTTLHTVINGMTAVGNTNVTIGVQTGLAILSPTAPFTEGAEYDDKEVRKFMIVLTDGENTQDRFSSNASSINTRTTAACTAAKTAGDITVYTIRVIDGDATLLSQCATSTAKFFDAKTASELIPVFQGIANEITSLRLTS